MKIYNNFLPTNIFNELKGTLLSNSFPWYYNDRVANPEDNEDFFFFHVFYQDAKTTSDFFQNLMSPIIGRLEFNYLHRVKANLYTKKFEQKPNAMHIDQYFPHKVFLYSINSNNGYTLFENGEKFESKENTAIVFDGFSKHASVAQTDEKIRVNININIQ